jgi:hypothetical protein
VAHDLTSEALTDAEVLGFATTFCSFASISEQAEDYAGYRREAIEQSKNGLDPESLSLVIDAGVVVFCPDDATRLGISV